MKFFRNTLIIVALHCSLAFGQNTISYRVGLNRFDIFTGFQYQRAVQQFSFVGAFDFGINRTIFQQRFFPKFAVGMKYDVIQNEKINLGPMIKSNFFLLNYNRLLNQKSYWIDVLSGVHFDYGKRFKFVLEAVIGPAKQFDYFASTGKYNSIFFVNYESSIGLAYSF
ncbi:MAG: hypothetical protein V4638_04920 [Bacteroidota bacterium]